MLNLVMIFLIFTSIHQADMEKYKNYPNPPMSYTKSVIKLHPKKALTHEIMGFYPYWMGSAFYDLDYDLLSTIAYFSVEVASNGSIIDDNGWPVGELIDTAHVHGVRVVLTATCFNTDTLRTLLGNPSNWQNLIDTLLVLVFDNNADGVNIDFEGVSYYSKDSLVQFMTALNDSFHNRDPSSFVTICTPAVDWNSAYDYDQLAYNSDGLFIMAYDYHWAGGDPGPVAPYDTSDTWGIYCDCWTIQDYVTWGLDENRDKFILGVPYYGYDWPCTDTLPGASATATASSKIYSTTASNAETYGKKWDDDSYTPYYTYLYSGTPHQCWFDDSLSLSRKYEKLKYENFKGTGMWALGYDGTRTELWGALREAFYVNPPSRVESFIVYGDTNGVHIEWRSSLNATSYNIYSIGADTTLIGNTTDTFYIWNTTLDTVRYIAVSALNGVDESELSQVLGCYGTSSDILIVYGYDRVTTGENTGDFIIYHGNSFYDLGIPFSSATNDAVLDSMVILSDYKTLDWVLCEEGTLDETFSDNEQILVSNYLDNGGQLFVSGSEIGYELYYKGTSTDSAFYVNYLHARYILDDANVYSSYGVNDLNGITVNYDDGTNGIYDVTYPDGIDTINGSKVEMVYSGTSYNSAVYYGDDIYSVFYMGFGFESIYNSVERDSLLSRILSLLDSSFDMPFKDNKHDIANNNVQFLYNPVKKEIAINSGEYVNIGIYDKIGRRVIKESIKNGIIPLKHLPEGLYFIILNNKNNEVIVKKKILVY